MPIVHSRPSKFLKTKNNATSRNDYLCFRPWLLNWRTAVRVRTSRVLNSDLYSFFNLLWGCKKGLPGLGTDLIESGTKTVLNCSDDLFFFYLQSNSRTKSIPNCGKDLFLDWTQRGIFCIWAFF